MPESQRDTAFEMATSNLRFGAGVTREVGMDLADMCARHVLVLTDRRLAALPPVATVRESLERERVSYDLFDRVRVEPTDASFREAIEMAIEDLAADYMPLDDMRGTAANRKIAAANLLRRFWLEVNAGAPATDVMAL